MFAKNITINECREIANKRNKELGVNVFLELVRGDVSIFCYNIMIAGAFDSYNERESQVLREMRGITFNNKTGELLARKYHKFFNHGENQGIKPDFNQSHVFLDKLDGSMCVPIIINDEIVMHTKRGYSDVAIKATEFMNQNPHIIAFCNTLIKIGFSPIFEYVSPDNLIVLKYDKTDLILTAIRDIQTGTYMHYDELKQLAKLRNISVVSDIKTDVMNAKLHLKNANDIEGYVIRFDSGEMVKMKADKYVLIHKSKDRLRFEKDVIKIILEDSVDDLVSLLDEDTAKSLLAFNTDFYKGIQETAKYIKSRVDFYKGNIDMNVDSRIQKKQFALQVFEIEKSGHNNLILPSYDLTVDQILDKIKKEIALYTGSEPRINSIRYVYNANWKDYYKLIGEDIE